MLMAMHGCLLPAHLLTCHSAATTTQYTASDDRVVPNSLNLFFLREYCWSNTVQHTGTESSAKDIVDN